jgi:hypothetical protein
MMEKSESDSISIMLSVEPEYAPNGFVPAT